jgi:hypothetical protein
MAVAPRSEGRTGRCGAGARTSIAQPPSDATTSWPADRVGRDRPPPRAVAGAAVGEAAAPVR